MVVPMEYTSKRQRNGSVDEDSGSSSGSRFIRNDLRSSCLPQEIQDMLIMGDLKHLGELERSMLMDYKKSMEVMIRQQKIHVSILEGRLEQLNNEISSGE